MTKALHKKNGSPAASFSRFIANEAHYRKVISRQAVRRCLDGYTLQVLPQETVLRRPDYGRPD